MSRSNEVRVGLGLGLGLGYSYFEAAEKVHNLELGQMKFSAELA